MAGSLKDFRAQYPQYDDMSDQDLADALHGKYYSDIPKDDYYKQIGFEAASTEPQYEPTILPITRVPKGQGNFGMDEHKLVVPGIIKELPTALWEGAKAGVSGDVERMKKTAPAAAMAVTGVGAAPGFANAAQSIGRNAVKAAAPVVRDLPAASRALVTSRETPVAASSATGQVPEGTTALTTPSKAATSAEDLLYKDLIDSGWTPQKIEERLKWLGPGATLADLEPFSGRAMAAAQFPKGQKRAARVLGSRQRGAENRLLKTVDDTLAPENYHEELEALKKKRTAEAQPARRDALDDAVQNKSIMATLSADPLVQRLVKSPEGKAGLREGAKLAALEETRTGIPVPRTEEWFYGTNFDDPNLQIVHVPTLRMLDAMKQGMSTMIKPYQDKFTGKLLNPPPYIVEMDKTVRDLTGVLRNSSSKYAKYLDSWAEPSQQMDALARGRQILDRDPEVTLNVLKRANDAEKEFMQIGLARALKDEIRRNPQAAVRLFSKGETLDQIRAVFPGKQEFRAMHRQVLREARKQETANRNLKGSQTTERQQGVKGIEQEPSDVPSEVAGAMLEAGTKNPLALARRAGRWMSRVGTKRAEELAPEVADELSSVLHSSDPIVQQRQIQRFRARTQLMDDQR